MCVLAGVPQCECMLLYLAKKLRSIFGHKRTVKTDPSHGRSLVRLGEGGGLL